MTMQSVTTLEEAAQDYTRRWLEAGEIAVATLRDGTRIRYVRAGSGPNLVLTHTVRTQLDLFQRVIPLLAPHFTVYAWTCRARLVGPEPGRPEGRTCPAVGPQGVHWHRRHRAPDLAGESIGATLSLSLAAELGDAVERVFAFNTYDYLPGLERSNLLASVIIKSVRAPVVGPIFAALENRSITGGIMKGGFHDPRSLPSDLLDELRPGWWPGRLQQGGADAAQGPSELRRGPRRAIVRSPRRSPSSGATRMGESAGPRRRRSRSHLTGSHHPRPDRTFQRFGAPSGLGRHHPGSDCEAEGLGGPLTACAPSRRLAELRSDTHDEQVSSTHVMIEHVTLRSPKTFEAVRSALEASVPPLDHAYAKLLLDGQVDEARAILERQAPLSIFGARDYGGLLLTAGLTRKAVQYDIGSPLTAARMTGMSYLPPCTRRSGAPSRGYGGRRRFRIRPPKKHLRPVQEQGGSTPSRRLSMSKLRGVLAAAAA